MPRIKNPRPPEPEAQHLRVNTFSKVHAIPRPTLYLMMRRGELNYIDTGHGRILPARLEDALKTRGA
jgi:hypothetical protein